MNTLGKIQKIHPWKAIYQSWYSASLYRDVVHRWRGLGYRFLLVELLVLWLIAAVHVQVVVVDYIDGYLKPVVKAMPKMILRDGSLYIDKPEKYQVQDPRNGKVIVNFDMTDKPILPAEPETGIFVEKRRVVFRTARAKERVYDYSERGELNPLFESSTLIKTLETIKMCAGLAVVGVFWLSSFVFCGLQVLLYGLIGKTMAMVAKRRLTFPQLVRIAVVALTPSLIIDTCQKLFCFGIPAWGLISAAITLGYLAYGVKVNTVGFEWSLSQAIPAEPLAKNSAS